MYTAFSVMYRTFTKKGQGRHDLVHLQTQHLGGRARRSTIPRPDATTKQFLSQPLLQSKTLPQKTKKLEDRIIY